MATFYSLPKLVWGPNVGVCMEPYNTGLHFIACPNCLCTKCGSGWSHITQGYIYSLPKLDGDQMWVCMEYYNGDCEYEDLTEAEENLETLRDAVERKKQQLKGKAFSSMKASICFLVFSGVLC